MTNQSPHDEPTNLQRALWAKAALAVFTAETYAGDEPDTMHAGDLEDALADLICDLLHFARLHPRMEAPEIHAHALRLFEQEIAAEEVCDCADRSWYGPYHDTQCPAGKSANCDAPHSHNLLDALDALTSSLNPRKIAPVLKAAGYSTDMWLAAHRNARKLIAKAKRRKERTGAPLKSTGGDRRTVFWIDERFQAEIRGNAPPPMATAQLVLKVYPITDGEVRDEPYEIFAVDEGRVIELENQMKE
jgi:hypothetical protein